MKITKEHVGKFVGHEHETSRGPYEILDVGDDGEAWMKNRHGKKGSYSVSATNWYLVETPKKPSERIAELTPRHSSCGMVPTVAEVVRVRVDAIVAYLDEQAANK